MVPTRTIGELNGVWALALKIQLAAAPVIVTTAVAWATWVTACIFTLNPSEPRYTFSEARADREELLRQMEAADRFVPADWQRRVEMIEGKLDEIQSSQAQILAKLNGVR